MDGLERAAMNDGSAVRYREKLVARGPAVILAALGALLGVAMLAAAVARGASGSPGAAVAMGLAAVVVTGMLTVLGIASGVSRVVVSERHLHVQAGVSLESISLAAIRSATRGVRSSLYRESNDYSVLGVGSATVTVVYAAANGAERRVKCSSETPDALIAAIGCGEAEAPASGVRAVAAGDDASPQRGDAEQGVEREQRGARRAGA